jgi:hypothetical protein
MGLRGFAGWFLLKHSRNHIVIWYKRGFDKQVIACLASNFFAK